MTAKAIPNLGRQLARMGNAHGVTPAASTRPAVTRNLTAMRKPGLSGPRAGM